MRVNFSMATADLVPNQQRYPLKNTPPLEQNILFCSQEALLLFQAKKKTQTIHSDVLNNGFRQTKSKQDSSSSQRNSQGELEAGKGG